MEKVKLGEYVKIRTGKLDANASSENGKYPFFTCSVTPLKIDKYSYDCECVLVAGNGDLNVKYYNGKSIYNTSYFLKYNTNSVKIRKKPGKIKKKTRNNLKISKKIYIELCFKYLNDKMQLTIGGRKL